MDARTTIQTDRCRSGERCRRHRRGVSLIWTTLALVVLVGFCSLAVDGGRIYLARAELRLAADAAARQAAVGLAASGPSLARSSAVTAAGDTKVDGVPLALDSAADVQFGSWDPAARRFTPLNGANESSANAVRVTARRTQARGNPVPLVWGGLVGRRSINLTVSATARVNPRKPGIVGLDSITMSGNASGSGNVTDSYRSRDGSLTGTTTTYNRGSIASNGDITLGGSSRVNGDARPGVGKSVVLGGGSGVSGSTAALLKPLDYPLDSAGPAATTNNNSSFGPYIDAGRNVTIGGASATVAGGTYYLNDLTVGSSGTLTFTGPATVYLTGNLRLDGTVNTYTSTPANLRLVFVTAGTTVALASNSAVYADIYAPGSAFTMGGSATLGGSVVARTVTMGGTARVLFDESLTITSPAVSLVQ